VTQEAAKKARILIVDDEPQITRVLRMACSANGYEVQDAPDGQSALRLFEEWHPNLVVTDLSMPGLDGVELCRAIREHSMAPIIVLSVRDQEKVKVRALDAGADDYVTKPFQMDELLARVRSALRRAALIPENQQATKITAGDFSIDADRLQVFFRGNEIHLTPKEFALLRYMMLHSDRVLTHRALLAAIWGNYSVDQPETLRVLVGQLRRKIESTEKPCYILTEPWVGYRFQPAGVPDLSL
jgi:two-component system, OmpR family, KDP operon response regulator KdpE